MSNREIFIDKLRQLSKEEMLERYVALLNTEKLTDYVSDLETKLAESEKKNFELVAKLNLKEHKPAFCTLADRDCEALGQVEELKQQLAEKDDEITQRLVIQERDYNQDKISFALEQLEKVKEYAFELFKKFCQSAEYHSNKSLVGRRFIEYYPFNDFIDNQIKAIKEMK